MKEAINFGLQNIAKKDKHYGPFAAVVVRNDVIISKAVNTVVDSNDPTAHAEINAIREACKTLQSAHLPDCELYTTCEPCPMCLGAIYWARLNKVYYATTSEDAKHFDFDDDKFYKDMVKPISKRDLVMHNICRDEAFTLLEAWDKSALKVRY